MITQKVIAALAIFLWATVSAFAQSAYTTGTEASSVAAGFPSPYGGAGIYAYARHYGHVRGARSHWRRR